MKNIIPHKNLILIVTADSLFFTLSWYMAYLLRFNFNIPEISTNFLIRILPVIVITKITIFYYFDIYRGMWRYTSIDDLFNIIKASIASMLIVLFLVVFTNRTSGLARSVFIIDSFLTIMMISVFRLSIRLFYWFDSDDALPKSIAEKFIKFKKINNSLKKRLLIIGAGDCGEQICREIRDNPKLKYKIVGFIDDAPEKRNKQMHGISVYGTTDDLEIICKKLKVEEILIAISSKTSLQMREIVSRCKATGLPYKTLPGMGELINGEVTVNAIREVDYRDLLGRGVVNLEEDRIGAYLKDARVLVTGAGGSIGSELCRQICRFRPSSINLMDRAESSLYEIEMELKRDYPYIKIIPKLADIRDRSQLTFAFKSFRPQVVFHAAAYKHVPMMEIQPWKAVRNNIVGTRNVVDISKEFHVNRFVLVSTDKAVRPTNVMGASKRAAELIVQGQNGVENSDRHFMTVRFGNVVGSVGSVVPLFKRQIANGGPVTVTHPEVTRYFMTIPEACQLILQAGAMGKGGEIFILDMGTPIKIIEMARDLIKLSGFEPDIDIKIEYTGLRPGEKLYEELITDGEGIIPTRHKKIMVLKGQPYDQDLLNEQIDNLSKLAYLQNSEGIRTMLCEIVPEYCPQNGHCEDDTDKKCDSDNMENNKLIMLDKNIKRAVGHG